MTDKECIHCGNTMELHMINKRIDIIVDLDDRGTQLPITPKAYICRKCGYVELALDGQDLKKISR